MARYHRVEDIIHLALALQVPGPGLCLEDVQRRFEVGRRTAERMRLAVDRLYPGMTWSKGPDGRKYWQLPAGHAIGLVTWRPEEIDALASAADEAEASADHERARILSALRDKLEALAAPDPATALASARDEGPMVRLRHAIVADHEIILHRRRRSGERVTHRVAPYGLLSGARLYLVATGGIARRPRLYALEETIEVEALDTTFERDPNVDLRRFAANAFGPFEEAPMEVCWRFAPPAADDALDYEFHPQQAIHRGNDGSVEVRFRAESLVELGWHLFAWGNRVEDRNAPVLKDRFATMMRRALDARPTARPTDRAEAHGS